MRRRVEITGVVQGVGFRPFVYNLARSFGLTGWCLNSGTGVTIEAEGAEVGAFITALRASAPPRANIERMSITRIAPHANIAEGFEIKESTSTNIGLTTTNISPDIATCADCTEELFDPANRRYLYPFINCTNCGPRYSITIGVPYDRPRTTMAAFTMCKACQSEYNDPTNRRFHAQPNCCAECGPRVWIETTNKSAKKIDEYANATDFTAIEIVRQALKKGAIAAIKGLGGFHLACDATNSEAVERLRSLKRSTRSKEQSNKPFALMVKSIEHAREFATINTTEARLLASATAPILLVDKRPDAHLPDSVAPGSATYGVMLPYTPLHHLLFYNTDGPLVLTSGNRSDEPIAIDNKEAKERLSGIADIFLFHDRVIHLRVDDSIMTVDNGRATVVRRARGITPTVIALKNSVPDAIGFGAQQKNSICIGKGVVAIVSQHIGELDTESAIGFQASIVKSLLEINNVVPKIVAHDFHQAYASTREAEKFASQNSIPKDRLFAIQHHHAHIVSCMAEHGLTGSVIGVAFDGTGAGTDGNVWGGEFFISERDSYIRRAHFKYIAMAGGDRAVEEPWRMALSYIQAACEELPHSERAAEVVGRVLARIPDRERNTVLQMIERNVNSPLTSSCGRLFDAVSSILGIRDRATYEGEAAVELEAAALVPTSADRTNAPGTKQTYDYKITEQKPTVKNGASPSVTNVAPPYVIDVGPMIRAIIEEHDSGVGRAEISKRFHRTIAAIITEVATRLSKEAGSLSNGTKITDVVLSGGVFQNRLLCRLAEEQLTRAGLTPWFNSAVPTNDGGISLGQVVAAGALFSKQSKESENLTCV